MRVRIPKTRAEILRDIARACSSPIEGVMCSKCGQKTATIYPWPEPTGTCVCPCVTPPWLVDFVRFASDPARMAEARAREKAARRPRGKRALTISVAAGIRTPRCDEVREAMAADEFRSLSERAFGRAGFDVTDPSIDAPDGAVVDGFERVGDRWVPSSIRFHPPEEPTLPAPIAAFASPGGRAFEVLPGTRSERWEGDSLWSECWPIRHEGVPAGKLWRDLNYGTTTAGEARWSATIRELYLDKIGLRLNSPRGVGYDVAAFDTPEEAAAAWARSADQILDWAARETAGR